MIVLGVVLAFSAACEKKSNKPADPGMSSALDRTDRSDRPAANGPVDTTPLPGVDIGKLDADKQKLFYKMIGSLDSPCGKGESLRKSFTSDTSCKRAPFAVRYVIALIEDEQTDEVVRDEYQRKYDSKGKPAKLDLAKAPRIGPEDAPVRIVEFFDYGCPHCAQFRPILERVASEHGGKVVEYFLMYPLGKWKDSKSAAQAAIAAYQQGKFKDMHDMLFAKAPVHDRDSVIGYAKELGLDAGKFEAAYNDAAAQVELDHAQGESVEVESTPTVFFNDRKYQGPLMAKYLGMWIDEELAVNR